MYTDTRVSSNVLRTRPEVKIVTEEVDTGNIISIVDWTNAYYAERRSTDAKTITSVRGPKPSGRLTICNPVDIVRTVHDLGPYVTLAAPPEFHYEYNPDRLIRYYARGNLFGHAVASDLRFVATSAPEVYYSDREYALQKAYAKANETTAHLMVTVAELRETLRMLRNPLYGLRKFLVKLLTRKKRYRKSPFDDVARDTWLEYRYGVMPLILDANDILAAYKAKASNIYKADATVRRRNPISKWSKLYDVGAGYQTTFDFELSEVFKTSAGLYTSVADPGIWGLGATQVLPTVWELIPWSFVWNWFLDVDTWINALMASSITPQSGYVSFRSSTQVKAVPVSWFNTKGPVGNSPPSCSVTKTTERLIRSKDLKVNLATVHFNNAFTTSWRRMVDSVALTWRRPGEIIKLIKR